MNKIKIEATNTLVVKHRDIVHNTVYSEKLTSNAMDYLYMLISQIHQDDTDFEWYSTTRAELEKLLGVDVKTKMLKKIMRSLMNLQLEKHNIEDGSIRVINVFSMAEINPNKDNILSFKFNSDMKPYLLNVAGRGGYLACSLEYAMKLPSFHSKVLYEICKDKLERYAYNKRSYSFELDVEYIKLVMSVPNYKYGDIKNRALKKAQDDFKRYTDISIEFQEKKKGRKVVAVEIIVTRTKEDLRNKKQPSNFKPYLQFRDYIKHTMDPYTNQHTEEIDGDVFLFPLVGNFNIYIDMDSDYFLIADKDGAIINDKDEVDYAWKLAYENKDKILKRI